MTSPGGEIHWTHRLFVDNADLFLPFLEGRTEMAVAEVEALGGIFEERGVPRDGRVLDFACGIGRHSVLLAQRGYEVTGVDLSPLFIDRARERAIGAGVDARFMIGDGLCLDRDLAARKPFDAVINMFTSHGYYGREADVGMFRQLHRLADPGTTLVVDTVNRDWLMSAFSSDGVEAAGDFVVIQKRSIDM